MRPCFATSLLLVSCMNVVAQTDFTLGTKTLIYACAIGFGFLAAWDAVDVLQKRDFDHLYLVSLPLLLGCLAGLVYLLKHRLVLSETSICQYGFRTKRILLEDIESITEHLGSYLIKAGKTSIRITTDLQHKEAFKNQIISQFQLLDTARHRIPGQGLAADYVSKLVHQIRHMAQKGLQAESLVKVDPSLFGQLDEPTYYVVYEHPMHDFLHRAYITELLPLKALLGQYDETFTTPKISIWVLPQSLAWFIFCSPEELIFYASN